MAGLLDLTDPTAGGLLSGFSPSAGMPGVMGMLANPQTAGLLGMAGGLLQAAGPSRLPVTNGQALGGGLQGMQQGIGNAIQNQRAMLTMQAMQGLLGGSGQSTPQTSAPAGAPVTGAPNTGPMSGLSAGLGSYAGYGGTSTGSGDSGAPSASGASIFGRTPQQLWQQGMMMNLAGIPGGADLMKMAAQYDPSLQAQMPTDITKMGTQGGMTPAQIQAANAAGVAKANYIAPVNARPGSILRDPLTMQPMAFNPNIPAGGTPMFDASGNVIGISTIPGAANVASTMAAAKAGGEGSMLPYSGVDAQGNPLPVTNRTAAATQGGGGLPLPLRNNNPGAMMPGGQLAQYPTMQAGLAALDGNLQSYGQQGVNTLSGVISKWAPPNDNNTQAYIQDVSQRLGIKPDQQIDLSNPAQRQAISTAIMLHENGPSAVFSQPGTPAGTGGSPNGGGPIYAAPPMGASTFASGQVNQMLGRWNALRDQNASAQTAISRLQNIAQLAPGAITGEEDDRRAYVNGLLSLAGIPGAQDAKTATDLLDKNANQIVTALGTGGMGTDAARSLIAAANPNAHMTVPAIQEAARSLSAQFQMTQAKADLLQPYANGNDPTGYTKAETAFNKNADPRIWEYQSIQDPAARQKFAAGVLKQDPKFGQKIQTLEQMGALQ